MILKKMSNRIILFYTALIIILLTIVSLFFIDLLRKAHLEIIKREMYEKLDFIDLEFRQHPADITNKERLKQILASISKIIDLRITIVSFDGTVLADTEIADVHKMDNHLYRREIKDAVRNGSGESVRYSNTLNRNMLYSAKRFSTFVIRLSKSLKEIDQSQLRLRKLIIITCFGIFFTSFFVIILLSRKITKPINETKNFAIQFAEGNYSKRILNYSDDEIGEVQKTLNTMADSLVEKINSLIFEQNKLTLTLESISDGIAVIDNNKRILIANKAFHDYFDYGAQSINKLYFEVIRNSRLNSAIEDAIQEGSAAQFEEMLRSGKFFSIYVKPITEKLILLGVLIVLHDITEKKKIEQMKTDLVANMSHELKTPITIIKGYLETIQENIENPAICREFIQKAIENAERQNSIINDILKLNELETSNDFTIVPIDLKAIIKNCVEILKPKAQKKNVTISIELNSLDDVIPGNVFLAEEIFFNLIDNAINYNLHGGTVIVDSKKEANRNSVCIIDSGIGIPEESLDRIFERFYRVDKSRSRATGGTGLGLSIVKHAAEILNWDIRVTSNSKGTIFSVVVG